MNAIRTGRVWSFLLHGRLLARYDASPAVPRGEAPKPCCHLYSLGGELLTDFRPDDHPWHHGLAWAFTYINGDNFWGGPTFVRSQGEYTWLENHGKQRHVRWLPFEPGKEACGFGELVEWVSAAGAVVLRERRRIAAQSWSANCWRLAFQSEFTNVTASALTLSSPVGQGRREGGYFGLTWRGSREWAGSRVYSSAGPAESMMGKASPWLAMMQPDERGRRATLVFADHPSNPRYPNRWFERHGSTPLVSFALAYEEPYQLAARASLSLRYNMLIADDVLSPAKMDAWVRRLPT